MACSCSSSRLPGLYKSLSVVHQSGLSPFRSLILTHRYLAATDLGCRLSFTTLGSLLTPTPLKIATARTPARTLFNTTHASHWST